MRKEDEEAEVNQLATQTQEVNLQSDGEAERNSSGGGGGGGSTDTADPVAATGPEAMDNLLLHCFLKTWKTSAKKIDLPILTSNFYRLHMIPACPDGVTLDIKKSSYKKLSKVKCVYFVLLYNTRCSFWWVKAMSGRGKNLL